jgi:hypothetical protein
MSFQPIVGVCMKRILVFFVLVMPAFAFAGEPYTQTIERDGKKIVERVDFSATVADGNQRFEFTGEKEHRVVVLDADGTVLREESTFENRSLVSVKTGDTVRITGTIQGKPVDRTVQLKGRSFYGSGFEWASRVLSKSAQKSLRFWMFSPKEDGKDIEMELRVQGTEKVGDVECVKVRIGLTGMMSAFWSATEWLVPDGRLARYEGNQGPGTPATVVTCAY